MRPLSEPSSTTVRFLVPQRPYDQLRRDSWCDGVHGSGGSHSIRPRHPCRRPRTLRELLLPRRKHWTRSYIRICVWRQWVKRYASDLAETLYFLKNDMCQMDHQFWNCVIYLTFFQNSCDDAHNSRDHVNHCFVFNMFIITLRQCVISLVLCFLRWQNGSDPES